MTEALRVARAEAADGRIVAVGQTLPANTATMLGLRDIAVHDPTSFEPYVSYLDRGGYDRRRYLQHFASVPPQAMLDLLGVRLILGPPGMRSEGLPAIYRGPDAVVLLNESASPPVYAARGDASVRVERRRANRLDVEVTSAGGASLSTTVVNLPGWTLRRDGQAWRIEPRTGTVIGWTVPPGQHRFSLRYTPPGLGDGMLMAGLGALLLIVLWRSDRGRASV